jgi:hypothetical protein
MFKDMKIYIMKFMNSRNYFYLIRNSRREPTNLVIPFSLYQIMTAYSISETISQSEYKPYKKIYYYYHRRDHLKQL